MSGLIWNNSDKIINALVTDEDTFNAQMIHIRFDFLQKSVQKLDSLFRV